MKPKPRAYRSSVFLALQHEERALTTPTFLDDLLQAKDTWVRQYSTICIVCRKSNDLSVDHLVTLSLGGFNAIENVIFICQGCNRRKQTLDPLEWLDKVKASAQLRELVHERLVEMYRNIELRDMFMRSYDGLIKKEAATAWVQRWITWLERRSKLPRRRW